MSLHVVANLSALIRALLFTLRIIVFASRTFRIFGIAVRLLYNWLSPAFVRLMIIKLYIRFTSAKYFCYHNISFSHLGSWYNLKIIRRSSRVLSDYFSIHFWFCVWESPEFLYTNHHTPGYSLHEFFTYTCYKCCKYRGAKWIHSFLCPEIIGHLFASFDHVPGP